MSRHDLVFGKADITVYAVLSCDRHRANNEQPTLSRSSVPSLSELWVAGGCSSP